MGAIALAILNVASGIEAMKTIVAATGFWRWLDTHPWSAIFWFLTLCSVVFAIDTAVQWLKAQFQNLRTNLDAKSDVKIVLAMNEKVMALTNRIIELERANAQRK